jgi:recombination protein RecR
MFSPLVQQLIDALRCLPGVGPKSAQRMALYLLQHQRQSGLVLASTLQRSLTEVNHCHQCRTLSETELCNLCTNLSRDPTLLCIVESPVNVAVIEQIGHYKGKYFVLSGHLSPLDGMGPQQIGINALLQRLANGEINEIILATNLTVEGEATAHYIANLVQDRPIQCTRLARGVPLGGELEYLDTATLALALAARKNMKDAFA